MEGPNKSVIIEITNLLKKYPKSEVNSLNNIDFCVFKGEKVGLFGPNGAGKTTFISLLCALFEPSKGTIKFTLNNQHFNPKAFRKHIGFVPQEFAFYEELTAYQNLSYFGALYEIPSDILKEKINTLLSKLGLSHVKNAKLTTFSGGMKRRINLAIGLLNDPEILFLDEPTVGVDIQSKTAIFSLLNELNSQGKTIVYTSHHLKEAEDFCNRIALIDAGSIIACDTLENLLIENNVLDLEQLLLTLTGNQLRD
jgi:ABC-2 type transport system ATP-binding protein